MYGHVFWITGLSGAGKTTIGTRLYYRLKKSFPNVVLLDGDVIKRLKDGNTPTLVRLVAKKLCNKHIRI